MSLASSPSFVAITAIALTHVAQQQPAPASGAGPRLTLGDFDGDGWVDAYAIHASGEERLWRNLGDGSFADATASAGLAGLAGSREAAWLDFDADGRLDLYLSAARVDRRLFRNVTGVTFEDATASAGLGELALDHEARWLDLNADGYIDLHARTASGDVLFHNDGRGRFEAIELGAAALALAEGASVVGETPSSASLAGVRLGDDRQARRPIVIYSSGATAGSASPSGASGSLDELDATSGSASSMVGNRCPQQLKDVITQNCIGVSTVPALGLLYPLSDKLFVDANGSIGLGTDTPQAFVHAVSSQPVLALQDSDPSAYAYTGGISFRTYWGYERAYLGDFSGTDDDLVLKNNAVSGALKLGAGNTTPLTISDNGRIGIGTTSPAVPLHVAGGGVVARIEGTPGFGTLQLGGTLGGLIEPTPGSPGDLLLSSYSSQIALAGPSTNQTGTGLGGIEVFCSSPTGDVLFNMFNGYHSLILDQDGRLGVGTDSPSNRLSVSGDADITDKLGVGTAAPLRPLHVRSDDDLARFEGTSGYLDVVNTAPSGLMLSTDGTGPLSIRTAGGSGPSQFSIDTAGRVGIGTTTPAATLDVSAPNNAALRVASNTGDAYLWLGGPTGVGFIRPTWDSVGDISMYSITSAGLGSQIYLAGPVNDIRGTGYGSVEISAWGTPSLTGDVFLSTQGQVRLMVDQDGRVGIGTTSPASTLSVAGNGAFSTSLSVGSSVGIGTSAPTSPLDVRGGTAWTTWNKGVELDDGSALKWRGSGAGWRHGIVQGANGLEIIRAQVDDGSGAHTKSIVIGNDGRVGIGSTGTPGSRLEVSDGNVGTFGASSHISLSGIGDQSIAVNTVTSGNAGLFLHNAGANAWRVSADRASDDFVIANDSAGVAWAGPALVTVKDSGDVGIGTSTPLAKLDVDGTTRTQCVTITGGCDIVEGFETGDATHEPGTVLVIDPRREGELCASSQSYDKKVAGVVSGAGGVRPGLALAQEGTLDGATKVAMAGRVYVKCTAENGAIEPGDRLTTASLAGHAMKATDAERCDGAVLGKAMSSLAEGTGLVLVLVNLQ